MIAFEGGLTELLAVRSGDTTAVQDLDLVGHGGGNGFREVSADVGVSLLCLSAGGNLSGSDSPYWLIRDYDLPVNLLSETGNILSKLKFTPNQLLWSHLQLL
jgi:hypothetical protein